MTARTILINQSIFGAHKYAGNNVSQEKIIKNVSNMLHNTLIEISGTKDFCKILITSSEGRPEYNHKENVIRIPYKSSNAGIDFYANLIHEYTHAQQQKIIEKPSSTPLQLMLKISRLLYPSPIENFMNNPKISYSCNYAELLARTAEAKAIREALAERRNSHPPDFSYEERKSYLATINHFDENTASQHSIKDLQRYIQSAKVSILVTPDRNNVLNKQSRTQLLKFWNEYAPSMLESAFNEFQKEYQALMQDAEKLKLEVENKIQTEQSIQNEVEQYWMNQRDEIVNEIKSQGIRITNIESISQQIPAQAYRIVGYEHMKQFLLDTTISKDNMYVIIDAQNLQTPTFIAFGQTDAQHDQTVTIDESLQILKYEDAPCAIDDIDFEL